MLRLVVALSLLSCCFALTLNDAILRTKFSEFKKTYGKEYRSLVEEEDRFKVFSDNVMAAEKHNARRMNSYSRGVNMWSDLTQEEWEQRFLGGYKRMVPGDGGAQESVKKTVDYMTQLPDSVDWREKGAVTDIKNQGACGSCWAFAATEQIESYTAIASGQLMTLSTQQMTSCTPNPLTCGGEGGCMGSTPPLGYNYVQLFGQISEEDYPYTSGSTSQTGDCQYDLASLSPVASITGYNNLPANDQQAVMDHIANVGPLAISVAASNFKDYTGGVFSGCGYDDNIGLNHGVQLVGYGSEDGTDFWIVRNSWGSAWGEQGYIRLLRESEPGCGVDSTTSGHVCAGGPGYDDAIHVCGMCGMLFETSYPLGAKLL